uniref:Albumin domain-containing protein n=1 Tax=Myripristis murdjan TaxID=586833 RepID=A0A668A0J5_9TELE
LLPSHPYFEMTREPLCRALSYTVYSRSSCLCLRVLVSLAQNLPNSTLDELAPLLDQAQTLATMCCSAEPKGDCDKDVEWLWSTVCASESLVERNSLKPCCENTENRTCFSVCVCVCVCVCVFCFSFRFIFFLSKRNDRMPPPLILRFAKKYSQTMESCCGEGDLMSCLSTKVCSPSINIQMRELTATCLVQQKYGKPFAKSKKVVEYSQKFPQVPVDAIQAMSEKIVESYAPCCQGDMVTCLRLRKQAFDEACTADSAFQMTGLAACCNADIFSRGHCIASLKPDPKPNGLSETYNLTDDIQTVCDSFLKSPEQAMEKLLYEVSRRHPEASRVVIFRYAEPAEQALRECCPREDRADCVKTAVFLGVKSAGSETLDAPLWLSLCRLITEYTQAMPQASLNDIQRLSVAVVEVYDECVNNVTDQELLACEDKLTDLIDVMSHEYDPASINSQIANCCNQSYSTRLLCILDMKPDTTFKIDPELPWAKICPREEDPVKTGKQKMPNTVERKQTDLK